MILFAQLTLVAGGLKLKEWTYGDQINPPTVAYFIVFILVIIIAEGFNQVDIRKETPFAEIGSEISREEFRDRVVEGE